MTKTIFKTILVLTCVTMGWTFSASAAGPNVLNLPTLEAQQSQGTGKPMVKGDAQFTYGKGAVINLMAAGTAKVLSYYLNTLATGQNWEALNVRTVGGTTGVLTEITDEMIESAVRSVNRSRFALLGAGDFGGGQVTLTYDIRALNRFLGANSVAATLSHDKLLRVLDEKYATPSIALNTASAPVGIARANAVIDLAERGTPSMVTETYSTRELANGANGTGQPGEALRAKLTQLKAAGAQVERITLQGAISRAAGVAAKPALSGLSIFLVYEARANSAFAAGYAVQASGLIDGNYEFMKRNCEGYDKEAQQYVGCDINAITQLLSASDLWFSTATISDEQE